MKVWMTHYDDRKEKSQSHEITIGMRLDNTDSDNIDMNIFLGVERCIQFADFPIGYGETKEEAIQDFKDKIKYMAESFAKIYDKINNDDIEIRELN